MWETSDERTSRVDGIVLLNLPFLFDDNDDIRTSAAVIGHWADNGAQLLQPMPDSRLDLNRDPNH
jgi:hypothetical protein